MPTRKEIGRILRGPSYYRSEIQHLQERIEYCRSQSQKCTQQINTLGGSRQQSPKTWEDWVTDIVTLGAKLNEVGAKHEQAVKDCREVLGGMQKERYKQILALHYIQNKDPQTIIRETGCTKSTVYRVLQESETIVLKYANLKV